MTWKFLLIAGLALLVRIWVVFAEPLPLSGDEIAHGNYIGYIYDHLSLPDSAAANELVPPGRDRLGHLSYEFYQPPGYYVITALLGGGVPVVSRLVSVLMFMVGFFFVWAATRAPGGDGDLLVLCALAFIPGLMVTTSTINNDVFLIMGSGISFYGCLKKKNWAFLLGIVVLATAKFHGFPILLALGIYYMRKHNRRWGITALAFAVVAAAIIYWRWDLQVENQGIQFLPPTILNVAKIVHETLVTGFMYPLYDRISPDMMGLGVIGGLILVYFAVRRYAHVPEMQKWVVLAVCLVWLGWSVFKQFPTGRYLYAAIPWLALKPGPRTNSGKTDLDRHKPPRGQ